MPSKARTALTANIIDVQRLLDIHAEKGGDGPGRRRGLEVLNKSAVVLLTAYWESYCEDIAEEAIEHIIKYAKSADVLPLEIKKLIAKELKESKNELAVWSVADGAWRQLLTDRLEKFKASRNWDFNTPKPTQVDKLFMDALGINKISDSWSWDKTTSEMARKKLMGFVELRGAIAHRGKSDDSVKKITVTGYLELVSRLAGKTGGVVNRHCRKITGKHLYVKRPTSVLAE
ncbi:HEPN domain-containing protein [Pseudomonas amygdali]|uniref:HEPN domain-containing protein n=1 Tax=Pseudomonas amygdali TaxID=47877 RepID=UPI000708A421|nr:HEPN domain-containing protein [Pseudomonas amygdali]